MSADSVGKKLIPSVANALKIMKPETAQLMKMNTNVTIVLRATTSPVVTVVRK